MSKQNSRRSFWQSIRQGLGFYRNPPYVEAKLRDDDVQSAKYLAIVVIFVEIYMLIRYIVKYGAMCETFGEFLHYTYSYWILLLVSALICLYAKFYLNGGMKRLGTYSRLFVFLFYATGIYFGAKTAMSDFSRGRMITCFLTMLMYGTIILVIRPYLSILLTVFTAGSFLYLLNNYSFNKAGEQVVMNSGDTINYVTFLIILGVLEISVYYQRYRDACKAQELEKVAVTDSLTGIPNQMKFETDATAYAAESIRMGRKPVYLCFDVHNFQTFNDQSGYDGGDELLRRLGRAVEAAFPGEPVARQSGDLFCALSCAADALARAERVRNDLRAAYPAATYMDVRVGTFTASDPAMSPRRAVDRAHYALKQVLGSDDVFALAYDEKMDREYLLRQYVLNNVERAVREGYIQVYYQPVVWAADGTLAGCEALVRWIDPEKGFMSPAVFIPTLEEGRMIHKLDLCVYETVCRSIRESLDAGLPVLPTSLNFSRLDFELMDAVGELEALAEKYRVPREYLHVEITESAVTQDVAGLKTAMKRLHELGYAVWLDDFGSGYSSMNVLKDMDFDMLKIDMEFLRGFHGNANARKIISSVIRLAESLGMETLCEGVETEEAIDFLRTEGCGRLQGFYYSKPIPREELLEKIESGAFHMSGA